MSDELATAIETQAQQPATMAGGGESVTQRSINEMIAADRYARQVSMANQANPFACITRVVIQSPGACDPR